MRAWQQAVAGCRARAGAPQLWLPAVLPTSAPLPAPQPAPRNLSIAAPSTSGRQEAPYELPWLATCHQASSNSWALAAAEWQLVGAHAALARERARALRCAGLQLLRSVGSLWPRALLARNLRQEPEPFEAELDAEDLEDEEFEDLGDWDDVELEELELEEFDDLGSGDAPPSTSSGGKGSP